MSVSMVLSRRKLLWGGAALCSNRRAIPDDLPLTGQAVPAMSSFDDLILGFMRENHVPGGALAVTKNGRLMYARGYGWADQDARIPYAPNMLCRIASVSKPFTAAAVLTLVQRGELNLDDCAFPILRIKPFPSGESGDKRLNQVTVRHLLHHTGGFDRAVSGDPMFMAARIARDMEIASPPSPRDIVRWQMGRPLDFEPGTREEYSNFGYCVLGRLIEKVTGSTYEKYVQSLLAPLGVTQMQIGKSRLSERAQNEVRYYDAANRTGTSVFVQDRGASVPLPYGAWDVAAMDAHGGWLASVVDLARFAAALEAPDGRNLLSGRSRRTLYERPAPPVGLEANGAPSPTFYACGWQVRPVGQTGRANYWHAGKLDGTATLLVRRFDGLSWAVNFNTDAVSESLAGKIDGPLHKAADAVPVWPTENRFREFYPNVT